MAWALKGLGQIYRPGYRYRKAGVRLNKLTLAEQLPMHLFGDERFERSRRVMKAVGENKRASRAEHRPLRRGMPRRALGDDVPTALAALHHVPSGSAPR